MNKNKFIKFQILDAIREKPLDTGELVALFNCEKSINNLKHHIEQLEQLECLRIEKPKEVKRGMANIHIFLKDFPENGYALLRALNPQPTVIQEEVKPADFGSEYLNKMLGATTITPKFGRLISPSVKSYQPSTQEQTNIRSRKKYFVSGSFLSQAV
jgi:hypothetical protein